LERRIDPILMGDEAARGRLACEVLTPRARVELPSAQADRDAMPDESVLEKTYDHRVDPAHGLGLQRVDAANRSLDESVAVGDRDTVLVPRGYHTVSARLGHDLCHLNVMAGPTRARAIANDPDHEWMLR
jgi:5-deoxy-glucuronate isomerase